MSSEGEIPLPYTGEKEAMAYWILQNTPREIPQVSNRNIPHAAHPNGTRGR